MNQDLVTIRNKKTGETRQVPRSQFGGQTSPTPDKLTSTSYANPFKQTPTPTTDTQPDGGSMLGGLANLLVPKTKGYLQELTGTGDPNNPDYSRFHEVESRLKDLPLSGKIQGYPELLGASLQDTFKPAAEMGSYILPFLTGGTSAMATKGASPVMSIINRILGRAVPNAMSGGLLSASKDEATPGSIASGAAGSAILPELFGFMKNPIGAMSGTLDELAAKSPTQTMLPSILQDLEEQGNKMAAFEPNGPAIKKTVQEMIDHYLGTSGDTGVVGQDIINEIRKASGAAANYGGNKLDPLSQASRLLNQLTKKELTSNIPAASPLLAGQSLGYGIDDLIGSLPGVGTPLKMAGRVAGSVAYKPLMSLLQKLTGTSVGRSIMSNLFNEE
jgi:hypothetical protein